MVDREDQNEEALEHDKKVKNRDRALKSMEK